MFVCNTLTNKDLPYDDRMDQLNRFLVLSVLLYKDTWRYLEKRLHRLCFNYDDFNWSWILNIPEFNELVPETINPKKSSQTTEQQERLHQRLLEQYRLFEANPPQMPAALATNLKLFEGAYGLNDADQLILTIGVLTSLEGRYKNIIELFKLQPHISSVQSFLVHFFASISRCSEKDLEKSLSNKSALIHNRLIEEFNFKIDDLENWIDLRRQVRNLILEPQKSIDVFATTSLKKSEKSHLSLGDFEYLNPILSDVIHYLRSAIDQGKQGVNILLYGAPGTGKSQLSRVIAQNLNADLFESPVVDEDGDPISDRIQAFNDSLLTLKDRPNTMLLVDEAQDIFKNFNQPFLTENTPQKGYLNKQLETNKTPTIWITNSISAMDPAYLRRFDFCFEVKVPPNAIREKIIEQKSNGCLSAAMVKCLGSRSDIAPAVVERAANFTATVLEQKSDIDFESVFTHHLNETLKFMGIRPMSAVNGAQPKDLYDPRLSTADADLVEIVEGIKTSKSARLCLYGVPGTGKTAWAKYLGQCLERPIIVKRCSDLLNCFVGGTEKLIAQAFEEARSENAVLVLDEADSFLQRRSGAHASWEVTQVNEMLTQIENFEGIFVATTNALDSMDEACLRRFDIKVKFDYLDEDKAEKLFVKYCDTLCPEEAVGEELLARVRNMTTLAPGDFATITNQNRFRPLRTPKALLERLESECSIKQGHSYHRKIGF